MTTIRWTEEEYAEWLRRNRGDQWTAAERKILEQRGKSSNHPTLPVADAKHPRRAFSKPKAEAQEVYSRYRIHIHHRSRRLADATGRSHKAAVDGIVRGGILRDDSPRHLEEIRETYEQAAVEETIITVEEA